MDEEERKRIERLMLMGQTRQDAMLPEQAAPQAPIAPGAVAPEPTVVASQPLTDAERANLMSGISPSAADISQTSVAAPQAQAPVVEPAAGVPVTNVPIAPGAPLGKDPLAQVSYYTMPDGSRRFLFPEPPTFDLTREEVEDPLIKPDFFIAPTNPEMTPMRPVNPQTGEFLSENVIAAGKAAGKTFPSQVSLPVPQASQASSAAMGQEETRARLGDMTLNEYLNAPAGTPGVSGLRTDAQGRMIAPGTLSDFERASQARQQRIGGTGSFAGDSAAREARIADRDRRPGETQTQRDTRIAQSRTTAGQTRALSFDDARRRAEGELAAKGIENPSASQVNALARAMQAAEPERLAALEAEKRQDALEFAQAIAAERRKEAEERRAQAAAIRAEAAEGRAVSAEGRAQAEEERKVREEQRKIQESLAAQRHAAKSQEQRDQEIAVKESAENRQILNMREIDDVSANEMADAQAFMKRENLVFDNGVLYQKQGWLKGKLIKVTNPAYMAQEGMKMLQKFSEGPTGGASSSPALPLLGDAATGYQGFSVRPAGTQSSAPTQTNPSPDRLPGETQNAYQQRMIKLERERRRVPAGI